MGKMSTKEDKSIYQIVREERGLTREEASDACIFLSADRIEKLENDKIQKRPEDIMAMADGYQAPELCNIYCATECPIGMKYVPKLELEDLSHITLKVIAALNILNKEKDRFIDISADGIIENDEVKDFIAIKKDVKKISNLAETLELWSERMLASGKIDREKYEEYLKE